MKRISLLLATVLGLGAIPAMAQDAAAPEIADTDGNGTWSMDELVVAYPDLTAETFTAVDANADGAVDQAELAAALADGLLPAAK
jgi:EF hand